MNQQENWNLPRSKGEPSEQAVFQEAEFFPPDLDYAKPGVFESPQKVKGLIGILESQRLLVLGGYQFDEKISLAHHLAWYIQQKLGEESRVLQWHPSDVPQRMQNSLGRYASGTVFVLPDVQPFHLGHDLVPLGDALCSRHQYAILTTDTSLEQWGARGNLEARGVWQSFNNRELFDDGYLLGCLTAELERSAAHLPESLQLRGGREGGALFGTLGLREIARRLASPSRLRMFVAALCGLKGKEVREEWLREKIGQLEGGGHAVDRWFRALEVREQLLTLGLTVFDGLFDDQVFAALELLVNHSWRSWDPLLPHFDYHELPTLEAYFNGTETKTRVTRITCSSSRYRSALLGSAWQLHKRRILSMLPTLVEMVQASVRGQGSSDRGQLLAGSGRDAAEQGDGAGSAEGTEEESREEESETLNEDHTRHSRWFGHGPERDLFSSVVRGQQFRKAVADLLSRLGLLSQDSVERILLDLAEYPHRDVQNVAASALANWRVIDREDGSRKLFKLLNAWRSEAFFKEWAVRRRSRRRNAGNSFAYVRATIASTLSYASLYDAPDRLAEPLVKLLKDLARDRTTKIVRDRVRFQTLPIVIGGHLLQLEDVIWDEMLNDSGLVHGIVDGLVIACFLRPEDGLPLLERWLARAMEIPEVPLEPGELSRREIAFSILALAHGALDSRQHELVPSAQTLFERFELIMSKSSHPWVLKSVIIAALQQIGTDLPDVSRFLQRLVSGVRIHDRELVVENLKALYLRQRRELWSHEEKRSSADGPEARAKPSGVLEVRGSAYPVWDTGQRPRTSLEEMLHEWLSDPSEPVAQQIALATVEDLAKTELERAEVAWLQEEAERREEEERSAYEVFEAPDSLVVNSGPLREVSLGKRTAVFLATFSNPALREKVRALFPEYLHQLKGRMMEEQPEVELPLWERVAQDGESWEVADALRRSHSIYSMLPLP